MTYDKELHDQIKRVRQQIARLGGVARAKSLTASERRDIAKNAAEARWS